MKKLLILFTLCCSLNAYAQQFTYPKIKFKSKILDDLKFNNWKVIHTAYGDLNNDKIQDIALILEYDKEIKEKRAYGDNETELIEEFQKPRILAVYFKFFDGYKLALQNNDFILRSEEGGSIGDPLKDIQIKDNTLCITFSGGSNWRWNLNYDFKYQQKQWFLIDAKNRYYHNDSGEMTENSYDFKNRKVTKTSGNLYNRNQSNTQELFDLKIKQNPTLSTLKKPWTWEILPDNFL